MADGLGSRAEAVEELLAFSDVGAWGNAQNPSVGVREIVLEEQAGVRGGGGALPKIAGQGQQGQEGQDQGQAFVHLENLLIHVVFRF